MRTMLNVSMFGRHMNKYIPGLTIWPCAADHLLTAVIFSLLPALSITRGRTRDSPSHLTNVKKDE